MKPIRRFTMPRQPVGTTQATGISHTDPFLFAAPKVRTLMYGYIGLPVIFPPGAKGDFHGAEAGLEAGLELPLIVHTQRTLLPMISVSSAGFDLGDPLVLQTFVTMMELFDAEEGNWVLQPMYPGGRVYSGFKMKYYAIAHYTDDVVESTECVIAASFTLVEGVLQNLPL